MTSQDIAEKVRAEIGEDWDRTNLHGCDLRQCLVQPQRLTFIGPQPEDRHDLWIVLEENPDTKKGYKIVYDEERDEFGLASPGFKSDLYFLGFYGAFFDAYDGM